MKILDLILEAREPTDIDTIKKDIIGQVKQTTDPALLHKIYTALHSTGLTHRIRGALTQLSDAKQYIDEITDIIINTPGTVQTKQQFAEGLLKGYVDLSLMTSGKRVHFEDLVKTNKICKDKNFLVNVFQALKNVGREQQKGSGEFALAVFSPKISIVGKGDLKINNQVIEVKASAGEKESSGGGRLGSTGDIGHDVSNIFAEYFGEQFVQQHPNINLNTFSTLMKASSLKPKELRAFATRLFEYMFKKSLSWVDLEPLINATVNKQSITKEYTQASYQAYKGPKEAYKFDGVMLMNFSIQELRYYEDFDEMFKDIYTPTAYIMYQGGRDASSSRVNLPAFTLKRQDIGDEPPLPQPGEQGPQVRQELAAYAQWYANKKKIGRNTKAISEITKFLQTMWNTNKLKNSKQVITALNTSLDKFISTLGNNVQQHEENPDPVKSGKK